MANERRKLLDGIGGTIENTSALPSGAQGLSAAGTTLTSAALANITGGVAAEEFVKIRLNPFGDLDLGAETVYVTALGSGATSGTIVRGREGTAATDYPAGVPWLAVVTAADLIGSGGVDAPWGGDLGYDTEFDRSYATTLPAGWSLVGTATYVEEFGAGHLDHVGTSALVAVAAVRSVPASATFTATAAVAGNGRGNINNTTAAALVLRDSTSGKLVVFGQSLYPGYAYYHVQTWNSPTSVQSTVVGPVYGAQAGRLYLRARKNAAWSSVDFALSTDGIGWHKIASAYDVSGWMTPDQIGFGCAHNQASSVDGSVSCPWFRVR